MPTSAPTVPTPSIPVGVGIDTSRYGHYATFLRSDLQPAAADLEFTETAQGYEKFRARLQTIRQRLGFVHFHIRLDAAGQYADNLLTFLHALFAPGADGDRLGSASISCGETHRNKNYRVAIFGHKKSDPIESAAVARYALTEQVTPCQALAPQLRLLRHVAGRLASQKRQWTRLINQLHNLLAGVFPELALVTRDLGARWILQLLDQYPTAAKVAAARRASLEAIPYLKHECIDSLQAHALASVASLTGPGAEQLIRDQVRQLRAAHLQQQSLEKQLVCTYRQLPENNRLHTIKGIGEVTAAILTAQILSIDRFDTEAQLVGYFGTFPVEESSGIDRDGRRRAPKRMVMSPRGCDLVRYYLYNAALSAAQHNPAVRPLYQRVRAKHPDHPSIAVGHAMCKLLRLVFVVWKSGQPFNPEHYPWEQAVHRDRSDQASSATEQAAGHHPETEPKKQVVTAACSEGTAPSGGTRSKNEPEQQAQTDRPLSQHAAGRTNASPWIDFAHLRRQLPLQRVLEHLGCFTHLRGRTAQRRGPCPVHAPGHGRTFSVHLDKNRFQCFDPGCGIKGDVIDLWAALHNLSLRDAALQLVDTFNLDPAPKPHGSEKRNG
jgi:transposase